MTACDGGRIEGSGVGTGRALCRMTMARLDPHGRAIRFSQGRTMMRLLGGTVLCELARPFAKKAGPAGAGRLATWPRGHGEGTATTGRPALNDPATARGGPHRWIDRAS